MSLRDEIWSEVYPQLQQLRLELSVSDDAPDDACGRLLDSEVRRLEAAALDEQGRCLDDDDVNWLRAQVDALLGAGPLEPFLRRDDVENIYFFGPHFGMLGLAGGRKERISGQVFADEEEMIRFISHLASTHGQTGRRFDSGAPILDLRLSSGERLFAAMEVSEEPYLTVRCHRHRRVHLEDLVANESLSEQAADFLRAAVRPPAPTNIMVCGALGAGKTTMLRALLGEIGPSEIVCTLEQTYELFVHESHPMTFAAETREANNEGLGAVEMAELSMRSLRSGADRVVIGEIRGPEAAAFLSACGTGSDGSMSTIHASTPRQALSRLLRFCLAGSGAEMRTALTQEITDVIHLVVLMRRDLRSGYRGVHAIAEVVPGDGGLETRDVFRRRGRRGELAYVAAPRNAELLERLRESGLDMSDWRPES